MRAAESAHVAAAPAAPAHPFSLPALATHRPPSLPLQRAPPQVCVKVLTDVLSSLTPAQRKELPAIEAKVGAYCEKPSGDKETKFCYYVDPIKREISQPVKNGVPPNVICDRLKKKAPEICALRFSGGAGAVAIKRDTDLAKLRVKDLKAFIAEKQIPCNPCTEKPDLQAAISNFFESHPEL